MFYNNVFVKNINSKNIKFLSVKQLYVLYVLLNNTYLKANSNKYISFYTNIYLALFNFNLSLRNLFLMFLFFFKTVDVINVSLIDNNSLFFKSNGLFSVSHGESSQKFNVFWKKWKNLKRPLTSSNVTSYYLDNFKKKLESYTKLGFVSVYNTYVVIRFKTNQLSNNIVNMGKPLLVSPKYSSSTVHKHLSVAESNNFEFQFLRKNKVYNKGRYSRTRQNYRTGVYLCMYLSVLSQFGLYYWFYKFSFNFTYLWWFFIGFVASFFLPKIIKYRLYEPTTLISKFFDFFRWVNLLIKSLFF